MTISLYDAAIPAMIRQLGTLSAILDKGEASAAARGIEPAVLINARLAPDMFPLSRQIQIATDAAKGCAARLAGVEIPSFADTETSFAELQERIARTVAFLESVDPARTQGDDNRLITVKMKSGDMVFPAQAYVLHFALPNFYFHVTTAYAILRHNGVDIGKMDYLGQVNSPAAKAA